MHVGGRIMSEKNMWNEIEVPKELDEIIKNTVSTGYKRMMQKNKMKTWKKASLALAGVAAAMMVLIGVGFANPMIAEAYSKIPMLGSVFSYLYGLDGQEIKFAQISENANLILDEEYISENAGISIQVKEYFCDKYSLYLSFEIVNESPFFTDITNEKGMIQIFSTESIETEVGETVSVGNGSLNVSGVFLDEYTFVGVARSGKSLDADSITDKIKYSISSTHIKVYSGEAVNDIVGEWSLFVNVLCSEECLQTKSINQVIDDTILLKEIRLQPYEIQVVMEEKTDTALAVEGLCIEVFDSKGRRLDTASEAATRFINNDNEQLEVWMFEKPTDAEAVTVFVLDEIKWMDEWKGNLYCDNPWTGQEIIDFLKENCNAYEEVNIQVIP